MAYKVNQNVTLGELELLASKTSTAIQSAVSKIAKETFLELLKTEFIPNFAFNSTTYAGATNPSLDGKPVLVIAVKQIDHNNSNAETITYSFLEAL